jgi:hypothetical protein
MAEEQLIDPTPAKIAYILDGQVVDILHTDERLAAIFLSNPIVIDVSDKFDNGSSDVIVGTKYDSETGQFSNIVG